MARTPRPRRCGSYRPGHEPHYIQVLRGRAGTSTPLRPGRLLEVHDDGILVVEVEGEMLRLWNHEPTRLRVLAARNDNEIALQWPNWHVLRTTSEQGWYAFSVARPEEATPCPIGPPPAGLVEQVEERGGFLLGGKELERLLDDVLGQPESG